MVVQNTLVELVQVPERTSRIAAKRGASVTRWLVLVAVKLYHTSMAEVRPNPQVAVGGRLWVAVATVPFTGTVQTLEVVRATAKEQSSLATCACAQLLSNSSKAQTSGIRWKNERIGCFIRIKERKWVKRGDGWQTISKMLRLPKL